jgi:hypothetical protein
MMAAKGRAGGRQTRAALYSTTPVTPSGRPQGAPQPAPSEASAEQEAPPGTSADEQAPPAATDSADTLARLREAKRRARQRG